MVFRPQNNCKNIVAQIVIIISKKTLLLFLQENLLPPFGNCIITSYSLIKCTTAAVPLFRGCAASITITFTRIRLALNPLILRLPHLTSQVVLAV